MRSCGRGVRRRTEVLAVAEFGLTGLGSMIRVLRVPSPQSFMDLPDEGKMRRIAAAW